MQYFSIPLRRTGVLTRLLSTLVLTSQPDGRNISRTNGWKSIVAGVIHGIEAIMIKYGLKSFFFFFLLLFFFFFFLAWSALVQDNLFFSRTGETNSQIGEIYSPSLTSPCQHPVPCNGNSLLRTIGQSQSSQSFRFPTRRDRSFIATNCVQKRQVPIKNKLVRSSGM